MESRAPSVSVPANLYYAILNKKEFFGVIPAHNP